MEASQPQRNIPPYLSERMVALSSISGPSSRRRPDPSVLHRGQRVRAIGSTAHFRPAPETFHEFLLNVLKWTLGKTWYFSELAKPANQQHQIVEWCVEYSDWTKNAPGKIQVDAERWIATASGGVKALQTLAYDVYTLRHCHAFTRRLRKRLSNRNEFQSARYEIAVAAMFCRAGFVVSFPTAKDKKMYDILARSPSGKSVVAIEVKSRRRRGLIHETGARDDLASLRGDVRSLLLDALSQRATNVTFMVFIDVNATPTPQSLGMDKPWIQDIKSLMDSMGTPAVDKPDYYQMLAFTNFPFHYAAPLKEHPPAETLVILPEYFSCPAADPEDLKHICAEIQHYGVPVEQV